MAIEITMPKLSDTMTDGQFVVWRKNIGDRIERGEVIAEIETDKAVMDLEAFASGILIKTMVHGGENVSVGAVLGLIGEEAEMADSTAASQLMTPVAEISQEATVPKQAVPPVKLMAEAIQADMLREKASPLVRRLAREQGLDLDRIKGSGADGRITREDLDVFAKQKQRKPAVASARLLAPAPATVQAAPAENVVSTPMWQAIAATVTKSWQTIPHFTAAVEIDMSACREIIRELKDGPNSVGYNALIIKACTVVLANFPLLYSSDSISSNDINISFAVSKPDGLLLPVIRQCQRLTVMEIERESCRLADKSRAGRLTSEEMAGGAFSVSNLGMYGIDAFNALIVPGQTAILAVAAVRERPVVQDGHLAIAPTMTATLSSDHRSIDGAYSASFLAELRSVLEKPVSLLMQL